MSQKNKTKNKWAVAWQNQQNDSAASVDSDQPGYPPSLISLCYALWVAKDSVLLHVDSEDWSDWANAQANLSLR